MGDPSFVQAGLRRAFPLMQAATTDLLKRLDRVADGKRGDWDADATMGHVTADIIFRSVLSRPLNAVDAARVHAAFRLYQVNAQRVIGLSALHLPTWFRRWRCRQLGAALKRPYAAVIRQRFAALAQGDTGLPDDMLTTLIRACDPVTGVGFSEVEVVGQAGTLFLAGMKPRPPGLGAVPAGLPPRAAGGGAP